MTTPDSPLPEQIAENANCSPVRADLTRQIERLLAADPICMGRVTCGTVEAIAALVAGSADDGGPQ